MPLSDTNQLLIAALRQHCTQEQRRRLPGASNALMLFLESFANHEPDRFGPVDAVEIRKALYSNFILGVRPPGSPIAFAVGNGASVPFLDLLLAVSPSSSIIGSGTHGNVVEAAAAPVLDKSLLGSFIMDSLQPSKGRVFDGVRGNSCALFDFPDDDNLLSTLENLWNLRRSKVTISQGRGLRRVVTLGCEPIDSFSCKALVVLLHASIRDTPTASIRAFELGIRYLVRVGRLLLVAARLADRLPELHPTTRPTARIDVLAEELQVMILRRAAAAEQVVNSEDVKRTPEKGHLDYVFKTPNAPHHGQRVELQSLSSSVDYLPLASGEERRLAIDDCLKRARNEGPLRLDRIWETIPQNATRAFGCNAGKCIERLPEAERNRCEVAERVSWHAVVLAQRRIGSLRLVNKHFAAVLKPFLYFPSVEHTRNDETSEECQRSFPTMLLQSVGEARVYITRLRAFVCNDGVLKFRKEYVSSSLLWRFFDKIGLTAHTQDGALVTTTPTPATLRISNATNGVAGSGFTAPTSLQAFPGFSLRTTDREHCVFDLRSSDKERPIGHQPEPLLTNFFARIDEFGCAASTIAAWKKTSAPHLGDAQRKEFDKIAIGVALPFKIAKTSTAEPIRIRITFHSRGGALETWSEPLFVVSQKLSTRVKHTLAKRERAVKRKEGLF